MLAGKMCLFRSYHLLSTTLVKPGSSLNPSRFVSSGERPVEDFLGRDKGSYVERLFASAASKEGAGSRALAGGSVEYGKSRRDSCPMVLLTMK